MFLFRMPVGQPLCFFRVLPKDRKHGEHKGGRQGNVDRHRSAKKDHQHDERRSGCPGSDAEAALLSAPHFGMAAANGKQDAEEKHE